jgi:Na+-transporting methylmalonyl-CoA/oxaloacetate decarboxylase gamma subunit
MAELIKTSMIYSLVGMSVVFSGLLILLGAMKCLNFFINDENEKSKNLTAQSPEDTLISSLPLDVQEAELNAACLGLSLYMYKRKYDEARQFILTGKSKERPNKPWCMSGRLIETNRDQGRFAVSLKRSSVQLTSLKGKE